MAAEQVVMLKRKQETKKIKKTRRTNKQNMDDQRAKKGKWDFKFSRR
jgi:hypothetical protein